MPVTYYGSGNAKERFQYWLDNPPKSLALDVETISIKERHPLGFAIAFSPTEAFYFQVHPEPPPELELLKPMLSSAMITKVAHNFMFDMSVFPLIPVIGDSIERSNIFDTNIAARLLGYRETALYLLANEVNMEATPVSAMLKPKQTMLDLDPAAVGDKCQNDAKVSFALYLEWKDKIRERFGEYFMVEMAVMPMLLDMSMRGILIDQKVRNELEVKLTDEVEFYRKYIQSYGIENPGSSQQVGYTLAKRGSFLPFTRNRNKRSLSTREGVLEFLDDPLAAAVLSYRHSSKFLSTYIIPIKDSDRFYTEYYLDTVVGRMNSRNRNIQNIPFEARKLLLPDNGVFVTGDYSREHMFILAKMSQDSEMLKVLYDPDPLKNDIHQHTASKMRIPRKLAKTLNYAIVYGATDKTISEQAKIKDKRICSRLLDGWFETYREAAGWITAVQREGLRTGWAEPTLFGRRIRLPDENPDAQKRKAVNYPILGSDGEVIKRAIIKCNRVGLGYPLMAITVHDSITWDGDVESRIPKEELENIPGFKIPFEIKSTFTWE